MNTRLAAEAGVGTAGTITGRIAVIGEEVTVQGFGLAGVLTRPADGRDAVLDAWASLPPDVVVVILTATAADVIPRERGGGLPLTVVIPG